MQLFKHWWKVFTRWWKEHRYLSSIAVIVIVVVLIIAGFPLAGYFGVKGTGVVWDLIGFNEHRGPILQPNEQYRPSKTLWDFLQLLIIPVLLGILTYWYSRLGGKSSQSIDNQGDAELQSYLDTISKLLLHNGLRGSQSSDEVQRIARARTRTMLRGSGPLRTVSLICFLSEIGLLNECIEDDLQGIDLHRTDLSRLTLSHANLTHADLSGADLSGADLSGANLSGADLSGTDLSGADLSGADLTQSTVTQKQLSKARSLKGATMPHGSKQPS